MRVRIRKPTRSVMQSQCGCEKAAWRMEPVRELSRPTDTLMGWTGANDPLSSMAGRLKFDTAEDAITFAKRRGWDYVVEAPHERIVTPKNYVQNFKTDRRVGNR